MDTCNNKIINQNLHGAHGCIDNGPQCATIDLEVPIAHGAWTSQSLRILLSLWHCHFWKRGSWVKNEIRQAICPAAVECPG